MHKLYRLCSLGQLSVGTESVCLHSSLQITMNFGHVEDHATYAQCAMTLGVVDQTLDVKAAPYSYHSTP